MTLFKRQAVALEARELESGGGSGGERLGAITKTASPELKEFQVARESRHRRDAKKPFPSRGTRERACILENQTA